MAVEERTPWAGLIVCMIVPTGLSLLGWVIAFGFLVLTLWVSAVVAVVQFWAAIRALHRDRGISAVLPWVLILLLSGSKGTRMGAPGVF